MRRSVIALALLAGSLAYAEEPTTTTPAFWGSPTVDNGACCATLAEVRQNIDRIDRELVRLIAERGHYVHEATRFKANPAQVEAPERVETVVRKAMSLAEENGLSARIAENTYRAMVRSFTDYEQDVFAKAVAAGQTPWKKERAEINRAERRRGRKVFKVNHRNERDERAKRRTENLGPR